MPVVVLCVAEAGDEVADVTRNFKRKREKNFSMWFLVVKNLNKGYDLHRGARFIASHEGRIFVRVGGIRIGLRIYGKVVFLGD